MRRFFPFALPLLAGCYAYAPIEPGTVRPGTSVRLRVSAAAADRLEPVLGASSGRLLSGVLIDAGTDTMVVEVPSVILAEVGSSLQTLHQRVSIGRTELLELETRKLDRMRTAAVVGPAAAVIAVILVKAIRSDPGKEQLPGGGGPGEVRVPVP
jgi:hypothetical protein